MDFLTFLNSYNSILNTAATIVLVIITGWYAYITKKILKSNEETTNELLRPYIVINIYSEDLIINFSIKNIGKRPAKNLKINFEPGLDTIEEINTPNRKNNHKPMLNQSFIPPNHKLTTMLNYNPYYLKEENRNHIYSVKFSYEDLNGKEYSSEYIFDISQYVYAEKTIKHTDNYHFKQIAKQLEEINKKLKK